MDALKITAFKTIKAFVNDLGDSFSKDSHPLALYERLINKTTHEHVEAVTKHISEFKKFCVNNESNILSSTPSFAEPITYTSKVFIDMNAIFKLEMDNDTKCAIWRHLLTMSFVLTGSEEAKKILDTQMSSVVKFEGNTNEDKFLNNIISKVEKHVNTESPNPQEAIANMMTSGMLPELMSSLTEGINSGQLNMANMMSSVHKLVGTISGEAGQQGTDAMSMLNNMMSMMNSSGQR